MQPWRLTIRAWLEGPSEPRVQESQQGELVTVLIFPSLTERASACSSLGYLDFNVINKKCEDIRQMAAIKSSHDVELVYFQILKFIHSEAPPTRGGRFWVRLFIMENNWLFWGCFWFLNCLSWEEDNKNVFLLKLEVIFLHGPNKGPME